MELDMEEDQEDEEESIEEGGILRALRGPGLPTEQDADRHSTTHIPCRSWCPACASGRARHPPHRRRVDQGEKITLELVCDCAFLWGGGGERALVSSLAI